MNTGQGGSDKKRGTAITPSMFDLMMRQPGGTEPDSATGKPASPAAPPASGKSGAGKKGKDVQFRPSLPG
ncbi:hypothetical protein OG203_23960 [Nocardia sp. NBC_01499]|uniref:hypothetical protein n=1 Tax=Nocardia sp. NBC_01499 TaxID=2903597 RepID=UPI0038684DCF